MKIRVRHCHYHVLDMRTRMPFQYGIATLVALPHLFVSIEAEIDGLTCRGVASEGLPPKWFTKNPQTRFEEDLPGLLEVITVAGEGAVAAGDQPSVFALWEELYRRQEAWAANTPHPPLLWGFGVSLLERGVIDAFCRARRQSFGPALRDNSFGIRLGAIHPELKDQAPSDLLPPIPPIPGNRLAVRHTVGLGDPLTDADLTETDPKDGLPVSLQGCLRQYGLRYLKIKLTGRAETDFPRLGRIARLLREEGMERTVTFTLDGNEQFRAVADFRTFWETLHREPELQEFLKQLIVVEQPLHRDTALEKATRQALCSWESRPPMIIDESDGTLDALRIALDGGYAGTSHKNCKGVFRGIANACLIAHRQKGTNRSLVLTGEDLANVGPVALLQDLAVMAQLGLTHVERNGHHYFRGLSMVPQSVQTAVLKHHPDLYTPLPDGCPTLRIDNGQLQIGSLLKSPFGYGWDFDPSIFTPLGEWKPSF